MYTDFYFNWATLTVTLTLNLPLDCRYSIFIHLALAAMIQLYDLHTLVLLISDCIEEMSHDMKESGLPINEDSEILQRFCVKLEYLLQVAQKRQYQSLSTNVVSLMSVSTCSSAVERRTRNRGIPGSNPLCYRFDVWAFRSINDSLFFS